MTNDLVISVALFLAPLLSTALFAYIYRLKRQSYLLWWTSGWGLLSLHYLSPLLAELTEAGTISASFHSSTFMLLCRWLLGGAVLLFFCAARRYADRNPHERLAVAGVVVFGLWVVAHSGGWVSISPNLGAAAVLVLIGSVFWNESRKQESLADLLLSIAFIVWATVLFVAYLPQARPAQWTVDARLLVIIPQLFTAVLMVMALYEEEKRRIERNMLALSNLNLTTSTFVGGEIQKMLSQALERVLSVVRIPAGALCLHQGDGQGPSSVVAIGLTDSFCASTQEENLDDHLVMMVARLGGLVVFRDLLRDASWSALDRDDHFRRFRELALQQGLRTVVGISLQAKDRVFGLLLLATPDPRRFTPAELRLLLALGHQIGMAVENSFLIQQTARRTEELHVVNEIGRALSSTLDLDTLFDKIYAEIQRMFDVTSFYIAFLDAQRNELQIHMEVTDGQRMPYRSRPAGNHLSEYITRLQQPVLVRENFAAEVRGLGLEPIQTAGSYAGVPLVSHDRGFGVMAVYSRLDRAFDEGHLELLRVLGSEAAIAIENARLFSEQESRNVQLALINDISRHAISTLNPDEMLAKIAQELEAGLSYDHIGICLLDYSSKELTIHAEAGKYRAEASMLGHRIPLGERLVGHVARSGEMATLDGLLVASGAGVLASQLTVLPDSVAGVALPVVYGDQLLGVFYVESRTPFRFSEQDIRLLRTLADLIASALHNAITFQKAQEQAITDGLTGLKTHRYFMEALSGEWKRATRASRNFSLVLMDLDRFKFVNDFYGHLEGDVVLQRVARIIEQNCRRSDTVARYGGDEFVVLMPETSIEQGRQIAQKLRAMIAGDPLLREKNITSSIGIASFPMHGSTPQELIQVADASMYISKHQGGNAVSTADSAGQGEPKKWKRDVLEAYLGVTLKRMFTTGPEAFDEIRQRLEQFTQSLGESAPAGAQASGDGLVTVPAAVIETLTALAQAVDAKDPYTNGHSRKVAAYAVILSRALGLTDLETEEIRLAALLHDVGKVGVPEAVLNKTGPLNSEEWLTMKSHAELGARLLEPLPQIRDIRMMVKHHHEFFDGSGYPDGLSGRQIPLGARIVAIADAYDTITSDRTYKRARAADDALREIERCAGAQFDAEFVRTFVDALRARSIPLVSPEDPLADSALFPPSEDRGTLAGAHKEPRPTTRSTPPPRPER